MALVASLFALLGRFVGRVLTTTLGWASVLLFGRIPQDRQVWLAVLTFGSLAWVAAVLGVLVPDVGAILLAAVPRPDWIPETWVRWAMLAVALALPALLGTVTLLLFDPDDRPSGGALAVQVARGYAIAPILAATLVILAVVGTIRKLDSLAHRRADAHVPIVVRPGRYERLVATIERTLSRNSLVTGRRPGPAVLTTPARLLARVAGRGIGRLVPDRLVELVGPGLTVAVYPADLSLSGSEEDVARARALVTRDIPSRDAWFTTTREAQELEDRLAALEHAGPAARAAALPAIDRDLLRLTIDQDTFEVLYRRRLQLAVEPASDLRAQTGRGTDERSAGPAGSPGTSLAARPRLTLGSAVGLVVAALTALDLVLLAFRERLPGLRRG